MDSNHRSHKQQIYSLPHLTALEFPRVFFWSWWTDSNPRPADYKSAALPAELHQQTGNRNYRNRKYSICQENFDILGGILVKSKFTDSLVRLCCSLCGTEIGQGEVYWYINGSVICRDCLPKYALEDYFSCRQVRGEEEDGI